MTKDKFEFASLRTPDRWQFYRLSLVVLRPAPLLGGFVAFLLFVGALSVLVGTIIGLRAFRDVGYPDSAILLRIAGALHSGHIYPDIDRPPYLVTIYGPLTYILLGFPYALAQSAGIPPQLPVRLFVAGALFLCIVLIFLISKRLYGSRDITPWFCALFAVSVTPLAKWSTQVRGDFFGVGFSLASVYLFLFSNGRLRSMAAAFCSGIAFLIKPTFVAAPVAIILWQFYKRRYRNAANWAGVYLFTVVVGYMIVLSREPLMLRHLVALQHGILEYRGALRILWVAVSQLVVPFAAVGGFLVLWNRKRASERLFLLLYCVHGWCVAILTVTWVGGNINYFWEPLLTSALLAGLGLCELQRTTGRTATTATAMLLVLLLPTLPLNLHHDLRDWRESYGKLREYHLRKTEWDSFVAVVSGRRLLSTFPDVTILSQTPEIPDPDLNKVLELRGAWKSDPVVTQIEDGVYDLIAIRQGEADGAGGYRGIRPWGDQMWRAMKRTYMPVCVFNKMEVWMARQRPGESYHNLLAIGCLPMTNRAVPRPR